MIHAVVFRPRQSLRIGDMKKSPPFWVPALLVVTAIPPFAWMLFLHYLQVGHGLPDKAAGAGVFGVLAGLFTFGGVQLAKNFWLHRSTRGLESNSIALTICCLICLGVLAIVRFSDEVRELIFGEFGTGFEIGFVLTIPFALAMAVALWRAEREVNQRAKGLAL